MTDKPQYAKLDPLDHWELAMWIAERLMERHDVDELDIGVTPGDLGTEVAVYEPGTAVEWIVVEVANIERLRRKRRGAGLDDAGGRVGESNDAPEARG